MINDIDINKIAVSNKLLLNKQDFRYFIGYKDDQNVWPLCIFFSIMSAYRIDFHETECMFFMIKYENFFDKYIKISEKN